jgi:hypothetical protein
MFVFTTVPAYAADHDRNDTQNPVIYKSEINVTENGGVYKIGPAMVIFPKDFIDEDRLPAKINVEISAVNGVPGIEFTPDIPDFNREVTIIMHQYEGLLYDKTAGKNIWVHIDNQKLKVKHFSRYAFS